MSYGIFGLTNYGKPTKKQKYSELSLKTYDRNNRKLSDVVTTLRHNLWITYQSVYRLVSATILPDYDLSIFKKVRRRTHALYVDDLFPHFYKDSKLWETYYVKIFKKLAGEIANFGQSIRRSAVIFVLLCRPDRPLTTEQVYLLNAFQKALDFSTDKSASTRFRFYLPTSSLPRSDGNGGKNLRIFALLADNLSINKTLELATKLKIRATFDTKKHRDDRGKRIQPGSKQWERFEKLCRDHDGSSSMYPVIFSSDNLDPDFEKVVRFYSRFTDVVFY